jgi:hypothetical protein
LRAGGAGVGEVRIALRGGGFTVSVSFALAAEPAGLETVTPKRAPSSPEAAVNVCAGASGAPGMAAPFFSHA